MAVQTQRALAKRAIKAADLMQEITKWIRRQALDKKIDLIAYTIGETVALDASTLGSITSSMAQLSADIRELQGHLTKEKIKGHGHP
jgi:hypothetical protein